MGLLDEMEGHSKQLTAALSALKKTRRERRRSVILHLRFRPSPKKRKRKKTSACTCHSHRRSGTRPCLQDQRETWSVQRSFRTFCTGIH